MEKNNFDFENLGQKVKELRIQERMTQVDVANALAVTPGYISNVENNRTAMSLRVLSYFAKLSGKTLDELVGNEVDTYVPTEKDLELQKAISNLTDDQKENLLETVKIWWKTAD